MFSSIPFFAQDTLQRVLLEIPITAKDIEVDRLGNIYAITLQNDLIKYNDKGVKQFEYSENGLGDLTVHTQNPLEILLYYPDFQIIKILDRTLSEIQSIDLTRLNLFQIPVIASSNDGNIWLFDSDHQQLLKIDRQGKILIQSQDLRMLVRQNISPRKLIEANNAVYVNVPDIGILQFDLFGNYSNSYDYQNIEHFQVEKNTLSILDKESSSELVQINLEMGIQTKIEFRPQAQKVIVYQDFLILLTQDNIFLIKE